MALSSFWFLLFFPEKNPNQQLNPSQKWPSSLNVRFIANSSRTHGAFMSLSWHFPVSFTAMSDSSRIHVIFMALSHTSLTWVQSAKIYWKSYPKSRCWWSIWFFCLISASFLAICQIHVGFMALSWHFHGAFFLLIFIVFPNSFMALAWQIHGTFMALSWHFPGTFLALSPLGMFGFAMKVPWKCHESAKPRWNLHVRFMSICVCLFLSVCRQCFFDVIFLRFRLINFFWGFLWSKYRLIRNTQTTNPNPQLVFSWCSYYVHYCSFRNMVSSSWHATTNKNKWNYETLKIANGLLPAPGMFFRTQISKFPGGYALICICFIMIWFTNMYNKICMVTHSVYMSSSTIIYISRYLVLLAQPWARH